MKAAVSIVLAISYVFVPFLGTFVDSAHAAPPRDAVVFIPGVQGSRLYGMSFDGPVKHWEPVAIDPLHIDLESLQTDDLGKSTYNIATLPGQIIDSVDFPYVYHKDVYSGILTTLASMKASRTIADWQVLQYDWRLSQSLAAAGDNKTFVYQNGQWYHQFYRMADTVIALADRKDVGKVSIVSHSNGGLVAKLLIDELNRRGRGDTVGKLIMVGVPQLGTPEGLAVLLHGANDSFPKTMVIPNDDMRELAEDAPGVYTLLPSKKYFERVPGSVVVFDNSVLNQTDTKDWQNTYGLLWNGNRVVTTHGEMLSFMAGLRDSRAEPSEGDLATPNLANSYLLFDGLNLQDVLDAWKAPSGLSVHQIVGTGLDTTKALEYAKYSCTIDCTAGSTPIINQSVFRLVSPDGDGTVMAQSANYLSAPTYYFDVRNFNKDTGTTNDHANLMSIGPILTLVNSILSGKITGPPSSPTDYVSAVDPYGSSSPDPVPPLPAPAATIYDRAPLAITQDSAYVSSHVDGHGLETKYYYQYGISNLGEAITGTYPLNTFSSDNNASVLISGLQCNTTYRYRIVATNSSGTVLGSERFVTTSPCSTTTPTPPIPPPPADPPAGFDFYAVESFCEAGSPQVVLAWNTSARADGYHVLRDGWLLATLGSDVTSYRDASVSAGATYPYRVEAYNSAGTSSATTSVPVAGSVCAGAPSVETNAATNISSNTAQLNGKVNPHGYSTNTWYEYGIGSMSNTTNVVSQGNGTSDIPFSFNTSISCGNTYQFRAVAESSQGRSYGATLSFFHPCVTLEPPSDLIGSVNDSKTLTLNWQDNSSQEAGFRVYQSKDGGEWSIRYTSGANETTWSTDTTWYEGQFCYQIRAVTSSAQDSAPSNTICFDLPIPPTTPPPTPEPTPLVFQPGPEGKDMWYLSGVANDTKLVVGGWGDKYWSFLQFDVSTLPNNPANVELQLYAYSNNGGSTTGMDVQTLKTSWSETTGWKGKLQATAYTSTAAPTVGQWISIDITSLYNSWKSGSLANYGLVLKPKATNNNFNYFYSSDYAGDPSLRPKLVITQ